MALAGKRLDRLPYRVWCLCGDSEMAEGSMWEAIQHAGWEGLDNLTAIIDVNRLGQTRETMLGWDIDGYVARLRAFGWHAIAIDGHDVDAIERAYAEAEAIHEPADRDRRPHDEGPRRAGGRGPARQARQAARRPGGGDRGARRRARPARAARQARQAATPHRVRDPRTPELPTWELGEEVATRKAYGEALTALGAIRGDVVALDGEVSNSTHSEDFREAHR